MSYCSIFDSGSLGYCLTDLGVSQLLVLQHRVQQSELNENSDKNNSEYALDVKCPEDKNEACKKPATMALVAQKRGDYEASHHGHESWQPEEKPSKLQTFFQISVTALAFLAFGGYLLCLIVQSIKSKGTTYFHPASSTAATISGMKRIKVYRRNRRSSLPPIESTQTYDSYGEYIGYGQNIPYQYYQTKYSE